MPCEIITVPCLSDNYAYLLHAPGAGWTALVDAPEAAPIKAALAERGWGLDFILLTHHHWDHVDAVEELREHYGATVIGAAADSHRLPPLDLKVSDEKSFSLGKETVQVIDVPGHTIGHVAFYLPKAEALFTADSLMALGCGRLFEGTAEMMFESLGKLTALPGKTMVYSGHEYTESNARFAATVDPDNTALQKRSEEIAAKRAEGLPTVPSSLNEERATNPFLRAGDAAIRRALNMEAANDVAVFAEIRKRKDSF